MKIIFRIDSNDQEKLNHFKKQITENPEMIVIPNIDELETFVISDSGIVTKLKSNNKTFIRGE